MPNLTDIPVLEVSVLGPISTRSLGSYPTDDAEGLRRRRLIVDFVVYLALSGGETTDAIDAEFFGLTSHPSEKRRSTAMLARRWLGQDRLPYTTRHGIMRLVNITTDWARFEHHHQRGDDGLALRFVRGQPLTGLSRHASGWADVRQAQMIATIHQTGLAYGREQLRRENWTEARIGIKAALAAEPTSLPAYRLVSALARHTGDHRALERSQQAQEHLGDRLHTPRYDVG